MRSFAVIALWAIALLDGAVGLLSVGMVEALLWDPVRPAPIGWLRGLMVFALVAGGPLLAGLVCLAASLGVGLRTRVGDWLALLSGLVHLFVPVLGMAVVGCSVGLLRRPMEGE